MKTVTGMTYCSSARFRTECSNRDEVVSNLSSPLTELSSLDEDDLSSSSQSVEMNSVFDEHAAAQVNRPICLPRIP